MVQDDRHSILFVPIARTVPDTPAAGTVTRFFVALLPMLLPTILMGGTLPVLSEHFSRVGKLPYLKVGSLYSLNTFGAMVGTAVAGFVLIEQLGLQNTIWLAAIVNIVIGILLIAFISRRTLLWQTEISTKVEPVIQHHYLLPIFFTTGFAALGLEVCWTRLLVLHLGSYVYAFSVMLQSFFWVWR